MASARTSIGLIAATLVCAAPACRTAARVVHTPTIVVSVRRGDARTPCAVLGARLREDRERAVEHGMAFIEAYLAPDERMRAMGADGAAIFFEIAQTATSARIRASAETTARSMAARVLPRYLEPGGVQLAQDFSDALELLIEGANFGMPTERLRDVLRARFRAFTDDDDAYGLPISRGGDLTDGQAFDMLLRAYTFERADVVSPSAFPVRFGLEAALRLVWSRPLAPLPELDTVAGDHVESAYLATHVALVLSEYGRRPLPTTVLGRFEVYLREGLPRFVRSRDVELAAETSDVLRQLGERDEVHVPLCSATQLLLDAQSPDGSWGRWARDATPYDALHPTWAAVTGLLERSPAAENAYSRRVRNILDALTRAPGLGDQRTRACSAFASKRDVISRMRKNPNRGSW